MDLQNYVNGKWVDARDGSRFDVFEPATGEVLATAPDSKPADVDAAIDAARAAFDTGPWATMSERDRARILLRAAEIARREHDRLVEMESRDSGKPLEEAKHDIDEVAFMFEYYGGWATKIHGDIPPVGPGAMSLVVKEPVGVAAMITPWNYPMLMAVQKVAPALAAGCTAILKPAEQTPLTALEIPKILEEAGLPPGVLNVVTGFGETAGHPLVVSPKVDKVGFTGSLEVGKLIMKNGADTLKRVTLELGGKSPNIVFADADFEHAIQGTCDGIFGNQGEICSAGSRVFVERSVYNDALEQMVAVAQAITMGGSLEPDTTMGPLVSKEQQERVLSYIAAGKAEGARLATTERTVTDERYRNGYFVPPTIFADVNNNMKIAREEIFGPVMSVIPFDDVDEVTRLANDTNFGLAAAIWTRDIGKALRTAKAIRAGTVWINDSQPAPTEAPWGGYKESGIGRELGPHGIEDYLETKHIYINIER
ncbi:MAG: aldehyde dehydrogenase family protein [Actinobacteria bacterium]|nr:aldehyde dehydrogenase family protein [Actinomycetota bacterium]